MLIVCTRDTDIRNWTADWQSNSAAWGTIHYIPTNLTPAQATDNFRQAIQALADGEPLCISGHGNDKAIGDEGSGPDDWGWDENQLAALLAATKVRIKLVLIRACARTVINLAPGVAVALGDIGAHQNLWLYSYSKEILIVTPYPDPDKTKLDKNVELQAAMVT
jgi:hypothetical protein